MAAARGSMGGDSSGCEHAALSDRLVGAGDGPAVERGGGGAVDRIRAGAPELAPGSRDGANPGDRRALVAAAGPAPRGSGSVRRPGGSQPGPALAATAVDRWSGPARAR